jgi:serine/threonine protein kinase
VAYFCGVTLKPYFCIVSEYYCNGTVIDYLKKYPAAPWDLIVSMAIGAAAGVLHLHKEKIIHRDLAARNLLLDSNCNGTAVTLLHTTHAHH